MVPPKRLRQVVLFGAAVVFPTAFLIGLGVRVVLQETELTKTRMVEDRQRAANQLARELTARLESIKLQEMNRLMRSAGQLRPRDTSPANPATVLVAEIKADRMTLPWETIGPSQGAPTPEFDKHKHLGEAEEFVRKDYAAAAKAFREALTKARLRRETYEARLLVARAESKAGHHQAALRLYSALLKDGGDEVDDEGIPYSLYAAERLASAGREAAAIQSYIAYELNRSRPHSPAALHMIQSLLESAPGVVAEQARGTVRTLLRHTGRVTALAKDLGRIRSRVESSESVWMAYGEEPWLITIAPPNLPAPGLLVAVSTAKLASPGAKLLAQRTQVSEPLGETLAGLHVEWDPIRFTTGQGSAARAILLATGLALVLGMTILGFYLLLRDVRRDMRMAEMRSQFVASVSHELKTPLTAIRMFAETVAMGRTRDDRTRTEYLETIVNECERLARLVDNVLDFSKIEQGKKIYRMRPTNLAHVLRSASRAMQYPLHQQGFTLRVSIEAEIPEVPADPDAIEQAILNLVSNAMKYSGDCREIVLRLTMREGQAVIEVEDRGVGITPEDQQRIFEKYYRVHSSETERIAGTGLGLTLVSHIVQAHGGDVTVQSVPSAGSTFTMRIPILAHSVEEARV